MLVAPLRTLILVLFLPVLGAVAQDAAAPFTARLVRELDFSPLTAWAPKWSPDGQWIALSLPKSEGIAVVKPDGTGLRVLTNEPRSGYRFAWSPDGQQIAYRSAKPEAGPRRYVIRLVDLNGNQADASDLIPEAQPPLWQTGPDGARWVTHDGKRQIAGRWSADSRSQRPANVTPPLVAAHDQELWLEEPERGKGRKLSAVGGIRPEWDRAARHVVFDAMDRILIASAADDLPARELCAGQHPAWSPDGEWLVYQITRDHSHAPADDRQHTADTLPHRHDDKTNHQIVESDLWIIRRDGTQRHQITHTPDVLETDPDWSSDGRSIVCRDERAGRLRILELERR